MLKLTSDSSHQFVSTACAINNVQHNKVECVCIKQQSQDEQPLISGKQTGPILRCAVVCGFFHSLTCSRLICLCSLVRHNTLTSAHHAASVIYVCNNNTEVQSSGDLYVKGKLDPQGTTHSHFSISFAIPPFHMTHTSSIQRLCVVWLQIILL